MKTVLIILICALPVSLYAFVGLKSSYWAPKSTINVYFLEGDYESKKLVEEIAKEWEKYANIKFNFNLSKHPMFANDSHIRITFSMGNWSKIGAEALKTESPYLPTMSLSIASLANKIESVKSDLVDADEYQQIIDTLKTPTCTISPHNISGYSDLKKEIKRTVLHEFGHALGLRHEHLNPLFPYRWNQSYVLNWCKKNQGWDAKVCRMNILTTLDPNLHDYSDFDESSIMIYALDPLMTMEQIEIPYITELSKTDLDKIEEIYPFN